MALPEKVVGLYQIDKGASEAFVLGVLCLVLDRVHIIVSKPVGVLVSVRRHNLGVLKIVLENNNAT